MKNKYNLFKITMAAIGLLYVNYVTAQCPAVTCPQNITLNNIPGTCGAVATYVPPLGTNVCGPPTAVVYNYTGAVQTFTVPAGVTSLTINAIGARGGASYNGGVPGYGGQVQTTLTVIPGQVLNIYVGNVGTVGSTNPPSLGGFNGGGEGHGYAGCCGGGGGGGATDIRIGGVAFANRVVVAAGGGGAGSDGGPTNGGSGGGLTGGTAQQGNNPGTVSATGGTQNAGGTGGSLNGYPPPGANGVLGVGGQAGGGLGGGGGGGYYGGGGGVWAGGGGGSSYADPILTAGTVHTANIQNGAGRLTVNYLLPVTTVLIAGLPSGSTFPVGTTTNTYQATDYLGNTAQCSFTVTVIDNQAPQIVAPANITVNNDPGVCGAMVIYNAPVGTDNCSGITSFVSGLGSGSVFPIGTTTETYTVTDPAGLTATCSFTVTVIDNEVPTITCPGNVANCNNVVTGIAPVSTSDNCAGTYVKYLITGATATFGNTDASGTIFNTGTSTVTYTAIDASNNSSSCSFTVVVNPTYNVPVSLSICPGDSIMLAGAYQTAAGTYIDTLNTAAMCDSIITTVLNLDILPSVTLDPFPKDTVCLDDGLVSLPLGSPLGGNYSGLGVVISGYFNPGLAGVGGHWVVYSRSNASGCSGLDSSYIYVKVCSKVGIEGLSNNSNIDIYPNPTNGLVSVSLGNTSTLVDVTVMEVSGRIVKSESYSNTNMLSLDLSELSAGMYFVTVKTDNQLRQVKVVKN